MARVILEQDELEKVVGGALTINGHELDMDKTVEELEAAYGIDGASILGNNYSAFKRKTLNQICNMSLIQMLGGEAYVQGLLDNYVAANPEVLDLFPTT